MHVTAQAKSLATALDFVARAVVKKYVGTASLACVKIETDGSRLVLTTCNLDVVLSAEIEVDAPFPAVCVSHKRLAGLIDALSAEVMLTHDGNHLSIKSGRGRWRLPVRDPADFPSIDVIAPGAASFMLPGAEARRLIRRTAHAICTEETSYYLCGLHIRHRDDKLVFVATDGKRLCEAQSTIVDPGLFAPVIVPTATVKLLDHVAAAGDVTVRVTSRLIEFTAGGLLVRSRLIDGTFPDYTHAIPKPSANAVVVEAAPVLAVVERLVAVAAGIEAAKSIGIAWENGSFSLCLSRAPDEGHEEIEPIDVNGAGRVAVRGSFLQEQIEALDGKHVRLDHDGNGALRVERPDEPMTVSAISSMRWEAAAQERRAA